MKFSKKVKVVAITIPFSIIAMTIIVGAANKLYDEGNVTEVCSGWKAEMRTMPIIIIRDDKASREFWHVYKDGDTLGCEEGVLAYQRGIQDNLDHGVIYIYYNATCVKIVNVQTCIINQEK